jgi:hypothetical protein
VQVCPKCGTNEIFEVRCIACLKREKPSKMEHSHGMRLHPECRKEILLGESSEVFRFPCRLCKEMTSVDVSFKNEYISINGSECKNCGEAILISTRESIKKKIYDNCCFCDLVLRKNDENVVELLSGDLEMSTIYRSLELHNSQERLSGVTGKLSRDKGGRFAHKICYTPERRDFVNRKIDEFGEVRKDAIKRSEASKAKGREERIRESLQKGNRIVALTLISFIPFSILSIIVVGHPFILLLLVPFLPVYLIGVGMPLENLCIVIIRDFTNYYR